MYKDRWDFDYTLCNQSLRKTLVMHWTAPAKRIQLWLHRHRGSGKGGQSRKPGIFFCYQDVGYWANKRFSLLSLLWWFNYHASLDKEYSYQDDGDWANKLFVISLISSLELSKMCNYEFIGGPLARYLSSTVVIEQQRMLYCEESHLVRGIVEGFGIQ